MPHRRDVHMIQRIACVEVGVPAIMPLEYPVLNRNIYIYIDDNKFRAEFSTFARELLNYRGGGGGGGGGGG
ncbi:hypothetical protein NL676_021808 [Syzygium grande]|nr:hypothetical protein NL676_021808 [Syzygium grande]